MYRQAVDIELNIPERRQYCAEAYYDIGIILNLQEEYDDAMKMLRKALWKSLAIVITKLPAHISLWEMFWRTK